MIIGVARVKPSMPRAMMSASDKRVHHLFRTRNICISVRILIILELLELLHYYSSHPANRQASTHATHNYLSIQWFSIVIGAGGLIQHKHALVCCSGGDLSACPQFYTAAAPSCLAVIDADHPMG